MITGRQSVAARGLLAWTINDLVTASGVAQPTIVDFENANRPSRMDTTRKIQDAFERAGIEFTAAGVHIAPPMYGFDGDDWYVHLLQDVLKANPDEVLIQNVDDQKSPTKVMEILREIYKNGTRFRLTAEEGNTYLSFPVSCYRWVPAKYFKNWVMIIYGDRVAFSINKESGCKVIKDKDFSEALKNQFDNVWNMFEPLDIESTANDRIDKSNL